MGIIVEILDLRALHALLTPQHRDPNRVLCIAVELVSKRRLAIAGRGGVAHLLPHRAALNAHALADQHTPMLQRFRRWNFERNADA